MVHLFRRNGTRDGTPIERLDGSIVVTHILVKFLKRLCQMQKPYLLDLGRLSGSNIEFFARRGCKVQVEDLLLALETDAEPESPGDRRAAAPGAEASAADDRPAGGGILVASDAATAAPSAPTAPPAATLPSMARPGARPTRRIVLPPRTFASTKPQARRPGQEARPRLATRNERLPTKFGYPDETFDAIVAWDIFNYYHPGAMTLLAAEARRILKPGGLLLGYFHARRPEGPETPRRYRVLDEGRVACDLQPGPPLQRHVYQNRDIEKMFLGLSIVELYFLKNATRELLMEKKTARAPAGRTLVRPAAPKPRFTIE
jgi:SAM-dependent methyltransferase